MWFAFADVCADMAIILHVFIYCSAALAIRFSSTGQHTHEVPRDNNSDSRCSEILIPRLIWLIPAVRENSADSLDPDPAIVQETGFVKQ